MGNTESSSKIPSKSIIKEKKNINNVDMTSKKKVNTLQNNYDSKYNKNIQPVQNNNMYNHRSKYETQVYETDNTELSKNLNNYQYFRPEIPDKSTDGQFGINSQIDNKYSPTVNQLYKSNVESRKESFENRN